MQHRVIKRTSSLSLITVARCAQDGQAQRYVVDQRSMRRSRCSGQRAPWILTCPAGPLDLCKIVAGQLKVCGCEVFLETLEPPGAGDGHDPGLLREEPGHDDV
jgi:hypothetical protein